METRQKRRGGGGGGERKGSRSRGKTVKEREGWGEEGG